MSGAAPKDSDLASKATKLKKTTTVDKSVVDKKAMAEQAKLEGKK